MQNLQPPRTSRVGQRRPCQHHGDRRGLSQHHRGLRGLPGLRGLRGLLCELPGVRQIAPSPQGHPTDDGSGCQTEQPRRMFRQPDQFVPSPSVARPLPPFPSSLSAPCRPCPRTRPKSTTVGHRSIERRVLPSFQRARAGGSRKLGCRGNPRSGPRTHLQDCKSPRRTTPNRSTEARPACAGWI